MNFSNGYTSKHRNSLCIACISVFMIIFVNLDDLTQIQINPTH